MEVSKFPRKTWGAAHAQTVCTRRSLRLLECLGTRLRMSVNNVVCRRSVGHPISVRISSFHDALTRKQKHYSLLDY